MLVRKSTDQEMLIRNSTDRKNAGTENYWLGKYWLEQLLIGIVLVREITDQENNA